jgi:peptidoglycan biosynthesis protein MviN/MurJ (putative lipid II flippase)
MSYVLAVDEISDQSVPVTAASAAVPRPIRSALVTAGSTVLMGGAAAATGILLARKFGRGAETDGFLAAYGVYLVFALTAQTLRIVLVPELTRADRDGRLRSEARSYAWAVLLVGLPVTVVVGVAAHPFAHALTAGLPQIASSTAAGALPWLVGGGFAQVLAAVAAAALAARGSYAVSAASFAAGAVSALVVFLALEGSHGPLSLAWGLAIGSAFSLGLPLVALHGQGLLATLSRPTRPLARIARIVQIVSLPLALQGFYVLALRLAAGLHVGDVTSLSYAYIFAATVVAATASTLALVSSAPLTRRGIDAGSATAHILHAVWLSLVVVAASAAIFALAGARIVHLLLGDSFGGASGHELGRTVVYLAPWMVASVALSITLPLLLVVERRAILPVVAAVSLVLHVLVSLALRRALGIEGLALALGISTLVVLAVLLAAVVRRALVGFAIGLAWPTLSVALLTTIAFGIPAILLPNAVAAAVGLLLYTLLLSMIRPRPLRDAWAYVRALH